MQRPDPTSAVNRLSLHARQGPAGKDGLPGHPGQRGETVSGLMFVKECFRVAPRDPKKKKHEIMPHGPHMNVKKEGTEREQRPVCFLLLFLLFSFLRQKQEEQQCSCIGRS